MENAGKMNSMMLKVAANPNPVKELVYWKRYLNPVQLSPVQEQLQLFNTDEYIETKEPLGQLELFDVKDYTFPYNIFSKSDT